MKYEFMKTNVIEIKNLHKKFKDTYAVKGVSLSIQEGEFVGLLGPNGAGKTTLIESIEGIQLPDEGTIQILGKNWKLNQEELHHYIGLSLQETKFIDKLTVLETLKLFASFYNLGFDRVNEIIEVVNLKDKGKTKTVHLSGGQRQRLALGIAIIHQPKVLLLDEPTTGLDPTARREVWNILEKLKREKGISMILTTHYMEEASFLCDRIVIMDKGEFIAEGTLQALISKNSKGDIIAFELESFLADDIIHKLGVYEINWDIPGIKGRLVVENSNLFLPEFIKLLTQMSFKIVSIECRKVTLEDLFLKLTGRKLTDA